MKTIVIATHNPGKILEYKEIFSGQPLKLLMLSDLNIKDEPEEDGKTFEENAIKKAEFYSRLTDLPVLAEDSGLEIDYLNGEPGVFSRRWPSSAEASAYAKASADKSAGKPGYKKTDEELINLVLQKLSGVPMEKRGAQFRVVIALRQSFWEKIITAEGLLRGFILEKPAAKIIPGFPFRSLFYVSEFGKALGELSMAEESLIGHRKKAISRLLPFLIK